MTTVRWDPFRNVTSLQDRINRLFDDAFPTALLEEDACSWRPAVDIYHTEGFIIIHVDLPGVRKSDITVDVKGNRLTIKGERKCTTEINEEACTCRERAFGSFARSFILPDQLAPDKVKAKFKDGVLEIEVPIPAEEKPKQVSVRVD